MFTYALLTEKLQGRGQLISVPHSSGLITNPVFVDTPHPSESFYRIYQELCQDRAYAPKCGCAEHVGNITSHLPRCQRNHLSANLLGIYCHPSAMKQSHIRPWRNTALILIKSRAQAVLKHLQTQY